MTNSAYLNIFGLALQIVGILVIGLSVKTVKHQSSSFGGGELMEEKTGKYIIGFTLPKPKATWSGIIIIIGGLVFQIIAEILR